VAIVGYYLFFLDFFALTSDGVTKGSRTGQDEQEDERDIRCSHIDPGALSPSFSDSLSFSFCLLFCSSLGEWQPF